VDGRGRRLAVIQGVEHMSILLHPQTHEEARLWLDQTFGVQPGARPYTDQRITWYGLGVLGALLAGSLLIPWTRPDVDAPTRPAWRRLVALVGGALVATFILWLVYRVGLNLNTLLGLRVGGYLLVWFCVAGIAALFILGVPLKAPGRKAVLVGLLLFALLWVGVGLLSSAVWLPWLLILRRLVLWPLGALLVLHWFLAAGEAVRGSTLVGRAGWWLFQSVLVLAALLLAVQLTPALGFLSLILPMTPVLFLFHGIPTLMQRSRWAIALSGALFLSWMFLAVFPLA
jgi:hypothetical protein